MAAGIKMQLPGKLMEKNGALPGAVDAHPCGGRSFDGAGYPKDRSKHFHGACSPKGVGPGKIKPDWGG